MKMKYNLKKGSPFIYGHGNLKLESGDESIVWEIKENLPCGLVYIESDGRLGAYKVVVLWHNLMAVEEPEKSEAQLKVEKARKLLEEAEKELNDL